MTAENIKEICRSAAMGMTCGEIAAVEEVSVEAVEKITDEYSETIADYKKFYEVREEQ